MVHAVLETRPMTQPITALRWSALAQSGEDEVSRLRGRVHI
jgi:hypothetical protein